MTPFSSSHHHVTLCQQEMEFADSINLKWFYRVLILSLCVLALCSIYNLIGTFAFKKADLPTLEMKPSGQLHKNHSGEEMTRLEQTHESAQSLVADKAKPERESTTESEIQETETNSWEKAFLLKLEKAITEVNASEVVQVGAHCNENETIGNSCDASKCLQTEFPDDPSVRLSQITSTSEFQLTDKDRNLLHKLSLGLNDSYDILLITAASSNHYEESQALLKNLHENVLPYLNDAKLVFYDIGLSPNQRKRVEKYCSCTVLTFPFAELPKFLRKLHCYSWKPIIMNAHISQCNIIVWMDASVRWSSDPERFLHFINQTRQRGVQISTTQHVSSIHTARETYHFFGDEACMYFPMRQFAATFVGFHNEPVVNRAILEPWLACAVNKRCMCPTRRTRVCYQSDEAYNEYLKGTGPLLYGLCHRFDQSALSVILQKLFGAYRSWVVISRDDLVEFLRGDKVHYFPQTLS